MLSAARDGILGERGAMSEPASTAEPPPGAHGGARDERDEPAPESGARSRNVLVALHGRRGHLGALELGRLIAGAFRAPLHGLIVGAGPIEASEVPAHLGIAAEALRGVVLHVEASEDPPGALASATKSRGAAVLVVAPEPEELMDERLGVGRLAAGALEAVMSGVVVVIAPTNRPSTRLRRILLPLDGTPSTAASITPAGELARRLGAELDIVMVGCASPRKEATNDGPPVSTPVPFEPGTMVAPLYVDQPQHEWAAFTEEFLARFLSAIGHCPHDVATRFFLGKGEPAAEILRFAEQLASDLVVLVWHGHLEDHHGSVFRDVLSGAPCPVMVLRR
ncbi:universal stress protein [Sorangium sp. So ce363]|uniref:universal stress protein n=1 Tax=Sorangium sp. So ce363 TaxID=3133304 RepID=UPI003F637E3F